MFPSLTIRFNQAVLPRANWRQGGGGSQEAADECLPSSRRDAGEAGVEQPRPDQRLSGVRADRERVAELLVHVAPHALVRLRRAEVAVAAAFGRVHGRISARALSVLGEVALAAALRRVRVVLQKEADVLQEGQACQRIDRRRLVGRRRGRC